MSKVTKSPDFVRRPHTITVHRADAGTVTYRDTSRDTLVIDARLPTSSAVRFLLVALAVVCFLAFGRLSVLAPLHLVVAGLGIALVIYATGPIGAGSTRLRLSDQTLIISRIPLSLGRKQTIDARSILRLSIDVTPAEVRLDAHLGDSVVVLVVVASVAEAAFVAQEIETYLGRPLR